MLKHINTWTREIEAAWQSGDLETYRKLVGQNRRVDQNAVEIAAMRSSLKARKGPFGWGLVR